MSRKSAAGSAPVSVESRPPHPGAFQTRNAGARCCRHPASHATRTPCPARPRASPLRPGPPARPSACARERCRFHIAFAEPDHRHLVGLGERVDLLDVAAPDLCQQTDHGIVSPVRSFKNRTSSRSTATDLAIGNTGRRVSGPPPKPYPSATRPPDHRDASVAPQQAEHRHRGARLRAAALMSKLARDGTQARMQRRLSRRPGSRPRAAPLTSLCPMCVPGPLTRDRFGCPFPTLAPTRPAATPALAQRRSGTPRGVHRNRRRGPGHLLS